MVKKVFSNFFQKIFSNRKWHTFGMENHVILKKNFDFFSNSSRVFILFTIYFVHHNMLKVEYTVKNYIKVWSLHCFNESENCKFFCTITTLNHYNRWWLLHVTEAYFCFIVVRSAYSKNVPKVISFFQVIRCPQTVLQ